jgi:hypothetical protein
LLLQTLRDLEAAQVKVIRLERQKADALRFIKMRTESLAERKAWHSRDMVEGTTARGIVIAATDELRALEVIEEYLTK